MKLLMNYFSSASFLMALIWAPSIPPLSIATMMLHDNSLKTNAGIQKYDISGSNTIPLGTSLPLMNFMSSAFVPLTTPLIFWPNRWLIPNSKAFASTLAFAPHVARKEEYTHTPRAHAPYEEESEEEHMLHARRRMMS
jgi:hypothetical protein